MKSKSFHYPQTNLACIFTMLILFLLASCSSSETDKKYSVNVYKTSQTGDNLKLILPTGADVRGDKKAIGLSIDPSIQFQKIVGFGASFTESSAWNLATIPVQKRKAVLNKLFSPTAGAGFTLTRTHINSCDYSNSHYTYVDQYDEALESFAVVEDMKGFSGDENHQVSGVVLDDASYDLIPMILEAAQVKGADFKIIASPWSPPSWMKGGETAEMTNGSLLPKYYGVWAEYLSKYVSAYRDQGIELWGLTPQNEPLHAHDARWDSNGFTPEQGRDFLRDFLGPQLVKDGHLKLENLDDGLRVLIYDHNKSTMMDYVRPTYADPEAAKYAWGTAFHWYASSHLEDNDWHVEDLDKLGKTWPSKGMIHTESSIDIDAEEPIGQYWRENKDYAGMFIPFDTYVFDMIKDLNHGTQGYVELCMILSNEGKPNPYDNFNSAPVLINPTTDEVLYTPLYYLLSHFSKFIRPDARRISVKGERAGELIYTAFKNIDNSIALVVYNKSQTNYSLDLSIESKVYQVDIGPRTLQTIHLKAAE